MSNIVERLRCSVAACWRWCKTSVGRCRWDYAARCVLTDTSSVGSRTARLVALRSAPDDCHRPHAYAPYRWRSVRWLCCSVTASAPAKQRYFPVYLYLRYVDFFGNLQNASYLYWWRDGLVVSALDQRPRGRGIESVGCGLSCSNRGPVALCTLGLGLLNPPSSRGR